MKNVTVIPVALALALALGCNRPNALQTRANEDRVGDNKGTVTPEQSGDPMAGDINQWAAGKLPTTRHHLDEAT